MVLICHGAEALDEGTAQHTEETTNIRKTHKTLGCALNCTRLQHVAYIVAPSNHAHETIVIVGRRDTMYLSNSNAQQIGLGGLAYICHMYILYAVYSIILQCPLVLGAVHGLHHQLVDLRLLGDVHASERSKVAALKQ